MSVSMALNTLKLNGRIAVIYSADPAQVGSVIYRSYNTRSWKSYQKVANDIKEGLEQAGFNHVICLADDQHLARQLAENKIDFAWLNTGGMQGVDPCCHGAALLESLGIPYVGHTPLNAALMDNKFLFKKELQQLAIPTAEYVLWHPEKPNKAEELVLRHNKLHFFGDAKLIVKPVSGRASNHVHLVNSLSELNVVCQQVYSHTQSAVLIEQFLPGDEYCASVIPTMGELASPTCFGIYQRNLGSGNRIFTSMDIKPIGTDSIITLSDEQQTHLNEMVTAYCRKLFAVLNLYGLFRLDLRMDSNGQLHVLEAYPKPDLGAVHNGTGSLVAMGLQELKVSYTQFLDYLVQVSLSHLSLHRTPKYHALLARIGAPCQ